MNQQRARRIGMGMKPRGEEEVLPTTEGQEVVSNDTPNDVQDVTVEGGGLKSVVTEIPAENLAEEPRLHETEIVDPLAAALKASAVEVFQKAYEEIKFPNPPSHMHVMGIDLARGDDKTVASVTDEDGNVRILSEAEMDAFVEKTKAAFTEQVEEEINPRTFIQPMDVGQQFPIQSEDGNTIIYKISEPYSPKPPKAEDFVITKSGREVGRGGRDRR